MPLRNDGYRSPCAARHSCPRCGYESNRGTGVGRIGIHPPPFVLMSTYEVDDLPTAATDCGAAAYLHKEHLSPNLLTRLWRATH
jgi:hypothetical protein